MTPLIRSSSSIAIASAFQNTLNVSITAWRWNVVSPRPLRRSISMPAHRTQVASRVWPRPGKEPPVDVDRAVLVAIHHQAAVLILTAIRPFPQGHVVHMLTPVAGLGRIVFINDIQFFPNMQALIHKHLHKAVQPPVIVHHAVAKLPLPPLFEGLVLLLLDDHLPLGKIADHDSPFSQLVCDEMGGFMQTVSLFTALLLRNTFVDFGEVNISAGFLFTLVPLRADLVELLVVPTVALEPAD